jgi:hypothetical protein
VTGDKSDLEIINSKGQREDILYRFPLKDKDKLMKIKYGKPLKYMIDLGEKHLEDKEA